MRPLALAALCAAPLATAGCTLFPFGGSPNSRAAGKPSPMGHGLVEYRAAFHVHSLLSHDSKGTFEEISAAARSLALDAVILCDHYAPGNAVRAPRGPVDGVLLVPGVELNAGKGGSILAFPLQRDYDNKVDPAARAREMAAQGAVSVMGHVEEVPEWNIGPFQGFEVYNLHAEYKAASRWGLVWRFAFLPADAFFESSIRRPSANLAAYDRELARGLRLAALAGHDAHANIHVLGATIGTYAELLRLFSNHVLAPELSIEAVTDGVRAGRTFVVFDYLGDGTAFSASYGDPGAPPDERAILGDEAPWSEERTLEVSVPAPPGGELRTRVLLDGALVIATDAARFSTTLPRPGVARVEVDLGGRLWIVASPMYIRGKEQETAHGRNEDNPP